MKHARHHTQQHGHLVDHGLDFRSLRRAEDAIERAPVLRGVVKQGERRRHGVVVEGGVVAVAAAQRVVLRNGAGRVLPVRTSSNRA